MSNTIPENTEVRVGGNPEFSETIKKLIDRTRRYPYNPSEQINGYYTNDDILLDVAAAARIRELEEALHDVFSSNENISCTLSTVHVWKPSMKKAYEENNNE